MTVFLCRHCHKTFIIDLEKHEVNTALWETCPACLAKIQHGEALEGESKPEFKPDSWFT